MRILTFASQKGGTGKTTLCLNCGVLADDDESAVLVDADDHGGLSHWRMQRGASSPIVTSLVNRSLDDIIEQARSAGAAWCLIDTAAGTPTRAGTTDQAIRTADLVVLPAKPGLLDIRTLKPTVDALHAAEKPACFVINEAPPRGSTPDAARTALSGYALPCSPTAVVHRAALANSILRGQAVHEYAQRDKAAKEIHDVWTWIRSQTHG